MKCVSLIKEVRCGGVGDEYCVQLHLHEGHLSCQRYSEVYQQENGNYFNTMTLIMTHCKYVLLQFTYTTLLQQRNLLQQWPCEMFKASVHQGQSSIINSKNKKALACCGTEWLLYVTSVGHFHEVGNNNYIPYCENVTASISHHFSALHLKGWTDPAVFSFSLSHQLHRRKCDLLALFQFASLQFQYS